MSYAVGYDFSEKEPGGLKLSSIDEFAAFIALIPTSVLVATTRERTVAFNETISQKPVREQQTSNKAKSAWCSDSSNEYDEYRRLGTTSYMLL